MLSYLSVLSIVTSYNEQNNLQILLICNSKIDETDGYKNWYKY